MQLIDICYVFLERIWIKGKLMSFHLIMPDQDGYSLIRQVRQMEVNPSNAITAIALTAFAKEEDQQQAITAGFQRHLAKPINPYKLVAVIASLVQ